MGSIRTCLVLIAALVVTAIVAGPPAMANERCKRFSPRAAPETATDGSPALAAPVTVISDKATEENPLVLEYEHELSYGVPMVQEVQEDELFFNFQVRSSKRAPGLHIRAEWEALPHTDIDLYLHDGAGRQVAYSDAWNVPGLDDLSDQVYYEGHGGLGYEFIEGFRATRCGGYTLMSETGRSPGTSVTLRVWLGPQDDHYDY